MVEGFNYGDGPVESANGWIVPALGNSFGQPLVLLHGFMQDEHSWEGCAQAMASGYYLSMPRMSADAPQSATLGALAEGVYGVVQQAILHTGCTRVALVGYSMGGRVALEYVRRYPETVSTLVLESAGIGPVDEEDRELMRQTNLGMVERIRQAASMDEVVDHWERLPLFESQAGLPEEAREDLRRMRLGRNPHELALLLEHAGSHTMPLAGETCQMLQGLGIPVLYVAGVLDQKYANIATLLGSFGVQPVLLECGHCVHLEMPSEYAMVVTGFIEHAAASGN